MLLAYAHTSLTVTVPDHSDNILLQAPLLSLSPWVMGRIRGNRELMSLPKITFRQRWELKNLIFLILWAGKCEVWLILSPRSPHQGLSIICTKKQAINTNQSTPYWLNFLPWIVSLFPYPCFLELSPTSHPGPRVCLLEESKSRQTLHKGNSGWEHPIRSGPQTQISELLYVSESGLILGWLCGLM